MPRKANPKLLQAETIDSENDSSIVVRTRMYYGVLATVPNIVITYFHAYCYFAKQMRVKNRNRQPRKLQSNLLGKEPVRSKGKKPGLAPDNDFEVQT